MKKIIELRPAEQYRTISVWPSVGRVISNSISSAINRQRPALLFFAALATLCGVFAEAFAPTLFAGIVFIVALYPFTTRPIEAGQSAEKGGKQ